MSREWYVAPYRVRPMAPFPGQYDDHFMSYVGPDPKSLKRFRGPVTKAGEAAEVARNWRETEGKKSDLYLLCVEEGVVTHCNKYDTDPAPSTYRCTWDRLVHEMTTGKFVPSQYKWGVGIFPVLTVKAGVKEYQSRVLIYMMGVHSPFYTFGFEGEPTQKTIERAKDLVTQTFGISQFIENREQL